MLKSPSRTVSTASHTHLDGLMRYAEFLEFGNVHLKIDRKTGLKAIVAVHNLQRGPAIGGCRFLPYPNMDMALEDALRLAYMMSYKAAINNLPHGGAKAVLLRPAYIPDKTAYFEKFGEFVDELGGRYITAVDSGTSEREMDIIAHKTKFVTCTSAHDNINNPSPLTALGVRRAIQAAVAFRWKRDSLDGLQVAIQGAGHVGFVLAEQVIALGAKVIMSDINTETLEHAVKTLGVTPCAPDKIIDADADIFAPCALGSVINRDTVYRIKAKIVAGCANNQLAHQHYATVLHDRGILYAPDFLINAGGLIHVAVLYDGGDLARSNKQIEGIYDTTYALFEEAEARNKSTHDVAIAIAKEKLIGK